ncbi:unnamed protein product [Camellia sinensis]
MESVSEDLKRWDSGSEMGRSKLKDLEMGGKREEVGWGERKGVEVGESSRRKTVKEWKGGEGLGLLGKRVEDREDSVAEQWWPSRSKAARLWMSLWMWGMSDLVARRILVKSGWPIGWFSGKVVVGVGPGAGGGAAALAILVVEREREREIL